MNKIHMSINWAIKYLASRKIPIPLQALLITGLILGMIYVFLVPPWWHYDEAGHFEYAWLIAHRYELPTMGDYDAEARRKIAESMVDNNWYSIRRTKLPDLNKSPADIGVEQKNGQPLYYIFIALPLQLVKNADMGLQNQVARLGSLLLFLGTILLSWKIMEELVPPDHPLQWMVPAFVAMLPGLLDTMTSINDDAGAVFVFSLFLLYSVQIIRKGFSLPRLAGLIFSLFLCYFTKNTTWIAFILSPIIILQGFLKRQTQWILWGVIALFAIVGVSTTLSWGDALYWYRFSLQESNTRVFQENAIHGDSVLQVETNANGDFSNPNQAQHIGQIIGGDTFEGLRGKTLTLGAWVWASQPVNVKFPIIGVATFDDVNRTQFKILDDETIYVTEKPTFHKVTFTVPEIAARGWIYLVPGYNIAQTKSATVYYDGLILTEGSFTNAPPQFNNKDASIGRWDNKQFINIIRNGSAESSGPRVRPWVDKYTVSIPNVQGKVSIILDALIDQTGTRWYFRSAYSSMFQTFWSKFAAGKVLLLSFYLYEILKYLSLLAVLGILFGIITNWKSIPWDVVFPLGLSTGFIWVSALLRGVPELINATNVIPWARYALPSIIPTSLAICSGWLTIFYLVKRLGAVEAHFKYGFLALMLSLNIFTMLSLESYFSDQYRTAFDILFFVTLFAVFCAIWLVAKLIQKKPQP